MTHGVLASRGRSAAVVAAWSVAAWSVALVSITSVGVAAQEPGWNLERHR